MVTLKRWRRAQQYEQNFWKNLVRQIENDTVKQLNWYQWRAKQLEEHLSKFADLMTIKKGKTLEIGNGPIGIINFLECPKRFAVDPLEDFYRESPTLAKLRQSEVIYLKGTGENLSFPESFFSLIIIDNVIDHTYAPEKILQEAHRVLVDDGFLYLTVNIHTEWGAMIHKLLALLYIDKGHPHTFTREAVCDLISRNEFRIRGEEVEDYQQVKLRNHKATSFKDRIKGYLGISEFQYQAICQKS